MYIELKTGYGDSGPARIGRVEFSKTVRIIYYRGKSFQPDSGGGRGSFCDVETGERYWISGPKKNRQDRHWAGAGDVEIDDDAREEYEKIISEKSASN
ncbi:MAG: 1-deoxy-D-xylulose-5-phosphate synthase [Alphaproteobacteria bacterium]|nr:1-deoxy-D-xylulose-5-phosphate synthase [Alphaproteobacteria bacterium]